MDLFFLGILLGLAVALSVTGLILNLIPNREKLVFNTDEEGAVSVTVSLNPYQIKKTMRKKLVIFRVENTHYNGKEV